MKKKNRVKSAREILEKHFTNKTQNPIKTPFYQTQLEVFYEKDYPPWIIRNALDELVDIGFLHEITEKEIPKIEKLFHIKKIRFFVNSKTIKNLDEKERVIRKCYKIAVHVNNYSSQKNRNMLGKHLENLVEAELEACQFRIVGRNTNKYNKRKWPGKENVDFIAKHKKRKITIGVQVKNSLDMMDRKKVDINLNICKHLQIFPVFVVRIFEPYIEYVNSQGGFSYEFKTQMYPLGQEDFVRKMYQKLSVKKTKAKNTLEFPISIRTKMPQRFRIRFQRWLNSSCNINRISKITNVNSSKHSQVTSVLETNSLN